MSRRKKILNIVVMGAFLANIFIIPPQKAHAFNLFRELGKGAKKAFRGLKKTTKFVLNLPDKATRWMGPVLGPVASFVLTKNIAKNPKLAKIFRRARKAQNVFSKIENVEKQVGEVKSLYKGEAKKLRDKASELEETRKQLAKDLLKHGDFDKYKEQVAAIQDLIEIHKKAADRFDNTANKIGVDDVVKMLGADFIKSTLRNIKDAVILDVSKELNKVVDPNIITKFLESGGGIDGVIDFFVEGELTKVMGESEDGDVDVDALREKVRESIKDEISKNKDFFRENWQQKINDIIKKKMVELDKTTQELEKKKEKVVGDDTFKGTTVSKEQQSEIDDFMKLLEESEEEEKEKSEDPSAPVFTDRCPSGYVYRPHWGVDCVQLNCPKVSNAHWGSTGRCICGSSGSIAENPEDPNKVCLFPRNYKSCPGCVYACVHLDEDCPLDGLVLPD